jgi:hypothetical protein
VSPEVLIGTLAYAAGIIDVLAPVSAAELAKEFAWEKVEEPLRHYQGQFYANEATRGYDYLRMVAQVRKGETVSL